MLITHGGGCGASYAPAEPPLDDASGTLDAVPGIGQSYVEALARGFAVMSTALANTGHNCNVAHNAESLMMAKERLIERYGRLRYAIGTGCSGGSVAQHTVANAYPGIYQGLVTTCSYPDVMSPGSQFADYHLMRAYFENPTTWSPGVVWSPTQIADVEGHLTPINAVTADEGLFTGAINPETACDGVAAPAPGDPRTRFDSDTNPGGVRCDILSLMVNQLGRRPESVWSPQEKEHRAAGFAGLPFGNAGVQYGLDALQGGRITPQQFVDLNAAIGGLDVNADPIAGRTAGDPASIANAYRTGLLNEFTHTDEIAMINHGGPDPGIAHDYSHAGLEPPAPPARPGAHRQPRRVVRPDAAARRRAVADGGVHRDGRLAGEGREGPSLGAAGAEDRRRQAGLAAGPLRRRRRPGRRLRGRPGAHQPVDPAPGVGRADGQRRAGLPAASRSTGRRTSSPSDCRSCSPTSSGRGCSRPSRRASATGRKPGVGQGPARTWLGYGTARTPVYGGAELPVPRGGRGWGGSGLPSGRSGGSDPDPSRAHAQPGRKSFPGYPGIADRARTLLR